MQVKDIMKAHVITAEKDSTVLDVAKLMEEYDVGCVPITQKRKVLGIITDRDIVLRTTIENKDVNNTSAERIMTPHVYSVKPDVNIEFALDLMKKQDIRRLPVIDNEVLCGIVSLGDFAKYEEASNQAKETYTKIVRD